MSNKYIVVYIDNEWPDLIERKVFYTLNEAQRYAEFIVKTECTVLDIEVES